jgi:hypothetical protein
MDRTPKPTRTIKATLTRFTIAAIACLGLTIGCLLTIDQDLRVLVGILAFIAFLFALLFGTDAGKAINREPRPQRSVRILGAILIFPLAILGAILIAAGLVGVLVSIRAIEMEVCTGNFSVETVLASMRLAVSLLMPLAGYRMLREGLRRDPNIVRVAQPGSKRIFHCVGGTLVPNIDVYARYRNWHIPAVVRFSRRRNDV